VTISLTIDASADVPLSEQIRQQVVALVASGRLVGGDRLPPVRELAGSLGLSAGTVAKAYRELEVAGVVVTASRAGTRVAPGAAPPGAAAGPLADAAEAYVSRARALGAGEVAIRAAVDAAMHGP